MKKILLSIFFAFCFFVSFGQNIINRSTASVTVSDARLQAQLNLLAPRYTDTTAANLSIGIDSCGAVIFTYDINWYWIRRCSPKRWQALPTITGSLNTTVNIVDSNHISICTINSCDTIQVNGIIGPITNITIINNTSLLVCGSDQEGPELITNGTFSGSATGWTLGTLWAYGTNNIEHSFGSTATSFQGGGLVEGGSYFVELEVNGGTVGTVAVSLDAGTSQTYNPDVGAVSFTGTWNAGINSKINFAPSNDFDGNITNVSVKQLLPNCDTLQFAPGQNFLDSVIIYARTPLYAENDSTFAIRQAGLQDSGYLSKEGYDSFYRKVDTLYYSNNGATVDTFLYDAGDALRNAWYVNDVQNGLISGGQVSWSGFGLAYTVEQAIYRINGVRYTSPPTVITLDDADATDPRIDAIGVDTSGNTTYLIGTAEANPVTPQVDQSYQIYLTSILVPATATIAPIDTIKIYDENDAAPTNWVPVTATGTTVDAANTLNPYRGTLSVNVTNISNGDNINFTNNTTTDLSLYQAVVLFIRLKAVIPNAANIRIRFLNGATNATNFVNIPINKSNITTYQAISIPLSAFTISNNNVDVFRINYTSNNATVNIGFYLDFIYLQDGVTPTIPGNTLVAYSGLSNIHTNNIDSIRLGGTPLNQNTTIAGAGFYTAISGGRFEIAKGANVVAANNLTLGNDGNLFTITGNTQINAITTANWQAGSVLTMIFTGTPTVKNNTAGGAGTAPFILAGATDFVAAANDVLTVIYDGTNWFEQSRKVTSSSGIYTASNGLTMTANNTVLGGSLTGNSAIATGSFTLTVSTATGVVNPLAVTSTTGSAVTITTTTGAGALINTTSGLGVSSTSTNSTAILGATTNGLGGSFTRENSNTATVNAVVNVQNTTTGTAAAGLGGKVVFTNELNDGTAVASNEVHSRWTDVTPATKSSQFEVWGTNLGGVLFKQMQINSAGDIRGFGTGVGVMATAGTTGGYFSGTSAGLVGESAAGTPVQANNTTTATNTVVTALSLSRQGTYAGAAGAGVKIGFDIHNTSSNVVVSGEIKNSFTVATAAAETSIYEFLLRNAGSAVTTMTLSGDGSILLRPITATAASAITPAEGMMLFVSSTNGTFLSIGFWGYRNGAWAAF